MSQPEDTDPNPMLPIDDPAPQPRVGTFGPSDLQVLSWFTSVELDMFQTEQAAGIRASFEDMASVLLELIPPCADRTAVLRELAAVQRSAVFAYTHNLDLEDRSAQ